VYLNHTGVNIDINFEDPNDGKVQPGVLLDTPAETNVTVKWVNGLTGETVSTQSKYKEITQKVQTGSVITTKAHEAPENFYFVGKLTEDEDYEVNPNGSFEEPAIQYGQIDLGVNSTANEVEQNSDYHYFADYYIQNYLDVGESYTVNLQDYVYFDHQKPIGQSDMHKRQIDLTVERINDAGDVRLILKDYHTNE